MKQEEKFEIAVAAFEAFLKRVNAHAFYFQEWGKQNDYKGTANVFYAWRESARKFTPSLWVTFAFTWRLTGQGLNFWHTRHLMWKRYIRENLNN